MPPGPFHMGSFGYIVNGVACVLTIFFNILFCFPYALPTTVALMNYNSVILVGVLFLTTFWWFFHATRNYEGPKLASMLESSVAEARRYSKV